MEWLFMTCHNHWIVCRLVRDDVRPFLAYSPMISIENSSEPFRALFGAVLSVVKSVSVETSEFSPGMELDVIPEEQEAPLPEHDIDEETVNDPPDSCNHHAEPGLMVCPCLPLPVICHVYLLLDHLVFPKLA